MISFNTNVFKYKKGFKIVNMLNGVIKQCKKKINIIGQFKKKNFIENSFYKPNIFIMKKPVNV